MRRFTITALSLVAAMFPALVAGARASTTQEAIFEADPQLLASPAATLATLRGLGVDRIKVAIPWNRIAPSPGSTRAPRHFNAASPAAYPASNWAPYDRILTQAAEDGISVTLMLAGPGPVWAQGPGAPRHSLWPGVWKPSPRGFGQFVRAVGTRYSGSYRPARGSAPLPRITSWSVWNEANYGVDLAPQAIDNDTIEVGAAWYRRLLDAAWSGLHATGHGHDTILIGETAPRGLDHPIGDFSGVKPLRFLRALYCVDSSYRQLRGSAASARGCPTTAAGSAAFAKQHPALFQAGGYADHPYAQGVPPNTPTYACGFNVCWSTTHPRSDPDYADFAELGRLGSVLDRLNRVYGSRSRFPIYSTEYGYWTNPPDKAPTAISPNLAATYLNWAEYLSYRQPRLRSYDQYLLVDTAAGNFASGLELASGKRLANFDAYRLPVYLPLTTAHKGQRLEVWGCVRPAHFAALDSGKPQSVRVQLRRSRRGRWTTLTTVPITNPRGYFDVHLPFRAGGTVRLAWSYPNGQTVYSRSVTVRVR